MNSETDYSLHYSKWHQNTDEHFAEAANSYSRLLEPILRNVPRNARMLDIGCGVGLLVNALARAGYSNTSGIDTSPQQIRIAEERGLPCETVPCGYRADYARNNRDAFDFVFMMDVLEHVPVEDEQEMVSFVRTILRPGGYFVLSVPNANSTFAMRWRHIDWTHHNAFTEHSLEFVLLSAGFRSVQFFPYEFGRKLRFPYVSQGTFWLLALRRMVRLYRRLEAIGALGREGLRIPLGLNLLAMAQKAV